MEEQPQNRAICPRINEKSISAVVMTSSNYPHQVGHDNGIVRHLPGRNVVLQTLGGVVVACGVVTVSLYHQVL